jgi:hypothetical protein
MFDPMSKENVDPFTKALETLKNDLSSCFSEKEKKSSTISLTTPRGTSKSIDFFSDMPPHELISWVKGNTSVTYVLQLNISKFFGKEKAIEVARFGMREMPGCCGIAISTGAYTQEAFRQRGIGTALNKFRMALAKAQGYTVLLCTAIDDGITEKILAKNGWHKGLSFKNRRTNNPITLYSVSL